MHPAHGWMERQSQRGNESNDSYIDDPLFTQNLRMRLLCWAISIDVTQTGPPLPFRSYGRVDDIDCMDDGS